MNVTFSVYELTMISEALGAFVVSQGEFLKSNVKDDFIFLEGRIDDLIISEISGPE